MNDEQSILDKYIPIVRGFAGLVMTFAFGIAGLAALYLLFGMFSGGFVQATVQDYKRLEPILTVAQTALTWGLGIGSIAFAISQWTEEAAGYILAGLALLIGFGLPLIFTGMGGVIKTSAMQHAFRAFSSGTFAPGFIGALLVVYDIVRRFVKAFQNRAVNPDEMEYGTEASKERRQVRLSLLAKCWEGPYCRDSIRPHCPIFIKKAACWKERRGCYCEEDIVVEAASKVQGVMLEMAPSPGFNYANASAPSASNITFSNIGGGSSLAGMGGSAGGASALPKSTAPAHMELSAGEKRERCRNCVIFNEHEQEKYKLLLPAVIVGSVLFILLFSVPLRHSVDLIFMNVDALATKMAFSGNSRIKLTNPPDLVAWGMVGAIGLMFVSKMLHALEWACFKAKI